MITQQILMTISIFNDAPQLLHFPLSPIEVSIFCDIFTENLGNLNLIKEYLEINLCTFFCLFRFFTSCFSYFDPEIFTLVSIIVLEVQCIVFLGFILLGYINSISTGIVDKFISVLALGFFYTFIFLVCFLLVSNFNLTSDFNYMAFLSFDNISILEMINNIIDISYAESGDASYGGSSSDAEDDNLDSEAETLVGDESDDETLNGDEESESESESDGHETEEIDDGYEADTES